MAQLWCFYTEIVVTLLSSCLSESLNWTQIKPWNNSTHVRAHALQTHTNIHHPCNFQYWLLRSTQSHPTTRKTTDWAKQDRHFMSFAYRLSFVFGAEVVVFFVVSWTQLFFLSWQFGLKEHVVQFGTVIVSSSQVWEINGLTSFNYTTTTHIHTLPLINCKAFYWSCVSKRHRGYRLCGMSSQPTPQVFVPLVHTCTHVHSYFFTPYMFKG